MPAEHRLAVRNGERVREVMLVGRVTLGRSPSCEISSADPRLSRTHATFEVVGGDVVVRDLDSSNGTTVNGARITEHRLRPGEQVEVGPFVIELLTTPDVVSERRPVVNADDDATVMLPLRGRSSAPPAPGDTAAAAAPPGKPIDPNDSRTRLMKRPAAVDELLRPADAPPPVQPADPNDSRTRLIKRPALEEILQPAPPAPVAPEPPRPAPPVTSKPTNVQRPQRVARPAAPAPAAIPTARPDGAELTFANTALLWIVPVVLVSFLAGIVPDLMEPDQRAPLLRAHYGALATVAVDLVKTSREPAMPIDQVTTALRGHAGVTAARIIGADGRVLAPLDQAATTVSPSPNMDDSAPRITETSDGLVDVQVPARTADGRPVMVAMTINPEQIHPASGGSPLATVLLIVSLGAAWLVARRLTLATDARLSRLGEEVELLTTQHITVARDPFSLSGGKRVVDAVNFALSAAGRLATDAPRAAGPAEAARPGAAATAAIETDASFRIVIADSGCEALLGINSRSAAGSHLIDALPDQAVSDEVMRLVTMATPDQIVSGEAVSGDRGIRLGISVTTGAGGAPLTIRFTRR